MATLTHVREAAADVEIHANDTDREHILFHLGLPVKQVWLWEPDTSTTPARSWCVIARSSAQLAERVAQPYLCQCRTWKSVEPVFDTGSRPWRPQRDADDGLRTAAALR